VTREEAAIEAERKQRAEPDAKWIATPRGDEWIVARIGVAPNDGEPAATATKPPPPTPHDAPQSPLERVVTQFGAGG
jgi:hypothetical protein